jgi:hypothetical protein
MIIAEPLGVEVSISRIHGILRCEFDTINLHHDLETVMLKFLLQSHRNMIMV